MGTVKHVYKGVRGIDQIADEFGISPDTLRNRIWRGMTIEEAVNLPVKNRGVNVRERRVRGHGVKHPAELSSLWKLALGMETN